MLQHKKPVAAEDLEGWTADVGGAYLWHPEASRTRPKSGTFAGEHVLDGPND